MKATQFNLLHIAGPTGILEVQTLSAQGALRGIALIAHPNPLEGGTFNNKIVHTLAKALSQEGYIAYCPNLRGVGNSEGVHDYGQGEVDDMVNVLEYARAQHGQLPIILAGFSFGTYVQSQFRQRLPDDIVQGLILIGPAVSRYTFPTVPANTLIIHGEEDEIVPLQSVLDWLRPQKIPLIVMPGTGHFFHGQLSVLIRFVQSYLSQIN